MTPPASVLHPLSRRATPCSRKVQATLQVCILAAQEQYGHESDLCLGFRGEQYCYDRRCQNLMWSLAAPVRPRYLFMSVKLLTYG